MRIAKRICVLILSLSMLAYSMFLLRKPSFYPNFHTYDAIVILILASTLIIWVFFQVKKLSKQAKYFRPTQILILAFSIMALIITSCKELTFQYKKQYVLNAPRDQIATYGRHFIVGYDDFNEVKSLIQNQAIVGIYLNASNVQGKSKSEIALEMAELQSIRKEQNLQPLFITTDQEGSIVNRLSPPLDKSVALSEFIQNGHIDTYGLRIASDNMAKELASLGVNVNFAPVLDLKVKLESGQEDKSNASQINSRSISDNVDQTIEVAKIYAQSLLNNGIIPTLKHFPGLGNTVGDTHVNQVTINAGGEELEEALQPFLSVASGNSSWIMFSHAVTQSIDANNPVSVSASAVKIVRRDWQLSNPIVTDDFSMLPISERGGGVGKASKEALENGIDYVLISYDHDLYYEAMYYLLRL